MAVPSTGPPMSWSSGTSSEHAYLHTCEYSKACRHRAGTSQLKRTVVLCVCERETYGTVRDHTSKRSLLASMSTASCSSPKELTQAVPPQDAVRTLNAIVLMASPMQMSSLMRFLSGVALVRNSSCHTTPHHNPKPARGSGVSLFVLRRRPMLCTRLRTRLSPISHRALRAARLAALDCLLAESGRAVFTRTDSP